MAMKLERENVRIIFDQLIDDVDLWGREGTEAEKVLCYISGLRDMANAVMDAILKLGGK
jgi:hypothetical protein